MGRRAAASAGQGSRSDPTQGWWLRPSSRLPGETWVPPPQRPIQGSIPLHDPGNRPLVLPWRPGLAPGARQIFTPMVIQTGLAAPPPTFLEYMFPDLTKLRGGRGGWNPDMGKSQTQGPGPRWRPRKAYCPGGKRAASNCLSSYSPTRGGLRLTLAGPEH